MLAAPQGWGEGHVCLMLADNSLVNKRHRTFIDSPLVSYVPVTSYLSHLGIYRYSRREMERSP